ncbi:uncharacterized protein AMSG_05967 [Thecamonas trahens ATCC 50062]|uniref:SH3 domain-containing protein n=1 Tax=Thecamonas trahens ATCC 50062 TaxID=461836 RepID=A0A0L0DBI9_THETB|nr:hypothetical protein AMSG_05967 [Thecamonas trahens ATCC 50062]KNC49702.1 hypothetical protein AMSG_05967 [Thecamonas trahens ATCC 50062]|eukprot:XP_013757495.1 hypothetical protein AMSG_05967 [Thecamonas trahens ATCC 50062]
MATPVRTRVTSPSDYVSSPVKVTLPNKWTEKEVEAKVFLTRQHEVYMWIQAALNAKLASADLATVLRDGVTLIALAKAIQADLVKDEEVVNVPSNATERKGNIRAFLRFCRRLAIPKRRCFAVSDLYRKANMYRVVNTMHVLAALAVRRGFHTPLAKIHPEDILFPPTVLADTVRYLRGIDKSHMGGTTKENLTAAADGLPGVSQHSLAFVRSGLPDKHISTVDLNASKPGARPALVHVFDMALAYQEESQDDDPLPDTLFHPSPTHRYEPVHPLEISAVAIASPTNAPSANEPEDLDALVASDLDDPIIDELELSGIDIDGASEIETEDLALDELPLHPPAADLLDLDNSSVSPVAGYEPDLDDLGIVVEDVGADDLDDLGLLVLDDDDDIHVGVLSGELADHADDVHHNFALSSDHAADPATAFELSDDDNDDVLPQAADPDLASLPLVATSASVAGFELSEDTPAAIMDAFAITDDDNGSPVQQAPDFALSSDGDDVPPTPAAQAAFAAFALSSDDDDVPSSEPSGIQVAVALFDYQAGAETQLSFKKGDKLRIYQDDENGWLVAQIGEAYGYVPANRVSLTGAVAPTSASVKAAAPNPTSRIAQLQAMLAAQGGAGGLFGKPTAPPSTGGAKPTAAPAPLATVTATRAKPPAKRQPSRKRRTRTRRS